MFRAAPGVIVLELRPRWESALKRNIADSGIRIRGCRKSKDALDLLEQMRGSLLILDLATGRGDALRLTETASRRSLAAGILVIATSGDADLEWPFRELGAHAFLSDSLRGEALAQVCSRLFTKPGMPHGAAMAGR